MTKEKVIKTIFIIFLFTFLVLIFAESNGYYESKISKTKTLTEKQIEQFEKDIKEGKNIDFTEYVINKEIDYTSFLSNNIYKVSLKIEKTLDKTIKYIFKKLIKLLESKKLLKNNFFCL